MNVIKIADLLSIETIKIDSFTETDFADMINRLQSEKAKNHLLTEESITAFLNALKNHPKSFQEVMSHRVLVNFFAEKNYSRKHFGNESKFQSNRETRIFIETFLLTELNSFLFQKMAKNHFEAICELTEVKDFFPLSVSERLVGELHQKLEQATIILRPPTGDFSKITYINDRHFYVLLNAFRSLALEEKVKEVFTAVKNIYYKDEQSEIARSTFAAMKSYNAFDLNLQEQISRFKNEIEENLNLLSEKKTKQHQLYRVIGALAVVIISVLIYHLFDYYEPIEENNVEYHSEPKKLDRYYTDMKFKIDSFRVFLTDYNPDEIRTLTAINDIKTGENPFETLYQNWPTGESTNNIRIENKTGYDVLVLENAVLYDSVKIPRTAHFIKSGDYLYVHFNRQDAKNIFNIYLGKKLATFQTKSNHLFIRNRSIVEYRFSELAPNASKILRKDYPADFDMVLKYDDGYLTTD